MRKKGPGMLLCVHFRRRPEFAISSAALVCYYACKCERKIANNAKKRSWSATMRAFSTPLSSDANENPPAWKKTTFGRNNAVIMLEDS